MIKQLKKRYNLWLFRKYGFDRGIFFERIPVIYKLIPLWSPSQYGCCEGAQIIEWVLQGIEEGKLYCEKDILAPQAMEANSSSSGTNFSTASTTGVIETSSS